MHRSPSLLILLSLYSFSLAQNYVYHFINKSKSWSDAKADCKQNYTDLATVHNMEDVRRLNETTNGTDAWIGLYNRTSDKREDRPWHWSQPGLTYIKSQANWNNGEPNDKNQIENCVFINNSLIWFDGPCNEPQCFICYNVSSDTPQLITTKSTWLQALHYCREHHTDLISGLDQLAKVDSTKLGNCGNWWWIGLFVDTWGWSDGSNSSFRNWHEKDYVLNPKPENKDCAKLDQGKWRSANCSEPKPFICYDDGYILVNKSLSWEDALYYCRKHYRDLAWITNNKEKRMVQERVKMADSDFVWLGLYYSCFLEEWIWANGRYVSNGNWKDPTPNDCGVSGAMAKGENQWFKMPSEKTFNFVCAKYC